MFTAFYLNIAVPITITLWKAYCQDGEVRGETLDEKPEKAGDGLP